MIARRDAIALGLAGAFAVLTPLVLLASAERRSPIPVRRALPPLTAAAPATLTAAYERALFGQPEGVAAEALPQDAPVLVGVAGRLGADAVALVRGADGATRTLAIGESVDGWQLASLAIDAAFFTRGAQRIRVPLQAE
ncbi:hypothetical protein [Sphingomonas sp. DT-207]|uniref:hypothetical protein n=1 Tax=Sphingomonas sp. DT-207 TaxID=3396167 RepID=UPI003F541ED5